MFFQQASAYVFKRKDAGSIDPTAEQRRDFFHQRVGFSDDEGHSINGEHPDGGVSHQRHVFFSKRIQGGIDNLHAPSGQAADGKIFLKLVFFHAFIVRSMAKFILCLAFLLE